MAELIKLIKESFDLSVKKRWIKEIQKAVDKQDKAHKDYCRHGIVVRELIKSYNEKYPDSKIKLKGGE